jgi:hypothetical protein
MMLHIVIGVGWTGGASYGQNIHDTLRYIRNISLFCEVCVPLL